MTLTENERRRARGMSPGKKKIIVEIVMGALFIELLYVAIRGAEKNDEITIYFVMTIANILVAIVMTIQLLAYIDTVEQNNSQANLVCDSLGKIANALEAIAEELKQIREYQQNPHISERLPRDKNNNDKDGKENPPKKIA
jgi:hypothetical protein